MNTNETANATTDPQPVSVGLDLVQVSRMQASLDAFGERLVRRVFTDREARYALAVPALAAERLAARFAAKEAAVKAFGWSEAGVGWRELEVVRRDDGACHLEFHGRASSLRHAARCRTALSLTHDGDYAAAIVVAVAHHDAQPPCLEPESHDRALTP